MNAADPIETQTFGPLRGVPLDITNKAINAAVEDALTQTLTDRGKRYGPFTGHAEITQDLKRLMQGTTKWGGLSYDQKEALEMIAHKIGRILNGDPDYADSWIDIAGYAKLVADRLEGVVR